MRFAESELMHISSVISYVAYSEIFRYSNIIIYIASNKMKWERLSGIHDVL